MSKRRLRRSKSPSKSKRWADRPRLTITQILAWADAFHRRTGTWPTVRSGRVQEAPQCTWPGINIALYHGNSGLPGGSSLSMLLNERRGPRQFNSTRWSGKPRLSLRQILDWADAYHDRTGSWPTVRGGRVRESPGDTWASVSQALYYGWRGLRGGSSLGLLLAQRRGHRLGAKSAALSTDQILIWADAYYARHRRWPGLVSGPIAEAPGETWGGVYMALYNGKRGLPRITLTRLLAKHRGARTQQEQQPLTMEQILAWAEAYHARHERWPGSHSGPIAGAPGETWDRINAALSFGVRGLPGGTTLAQLIAKHTQQQPLTAERILAWADVYRARHGRWPNSHSGPIAGAPGETWNRINAALSSGRRGLPGGTNLAQFIAKHRGPQQTLTIDLILAWADAHYARQGRWPGAHSGHIAGSQRETWKGIDADLSIGRRGLPGGTTLARLIARHRRPHQTLTIERILAWADAHHARHGRWPNRRSGVVAGASGETWSRIHAALSTGARGLPGGTTLAELMARHGRRTPRRPRRAH